MVATLCFDESCVDVEVLQWAVTSLGGVALGLGDISASRHVLRRSSGLVVRAQRVSARADNRCPALHRLPRMHYIVCVRMSPWVSNLGVFVCVCCLLSVAAAAGLTFPARR